MRASSTQDYYKKKEQIIATQSLFIKLRSDFIYIKMMVPTFVKSRSKKVHKPNQKINCLPLMNFGKKKEKLFF